MCIIFWFCRMKSTFGLTRLKSSCLRAEFPCGEYRGWSNSKIFPASRSPLNSLTCAVLHLQNQQHHTFFVSPCIFPSLVTISKISSLLLRLRWKDCAHTMSGQLIINLIYICKLNSFLQDLNAIILPKTCLELWNVSKVKVFKSQFTSLSVALSAVLLCQGLFAFSALYFLKLVDLFVLNTFFF